MGTFLVTGADRGIGRALCVQLQSCGERVIAAYLGDSPLLERLGVQVEQNIDVTSDAAIIWRISKSTCHADQRR
jgi:NAD(P)-dependent dehydrogenase (short-subunit alcohol dehydrogenase family)